MSEYVFKLPDLGEGTVESEIGEWNIKVGDTVAEEAIVGTMMTDKAAVELSAPVTGKVVSLAGEPGDVVAVGAPLVVFETDSTVQVEEPVTETTSAQASTASSESPEPEAIKPVVELNQKVITSPAIRRRARQAGVDLSIVPGSGSGGRILGSDFDRFLKTRVADIAAAPASPATAKITEIKVIGLRRVIAERMAEANREVPHFSYVEEVDITELEALRQHLNTSRSDKSDRLTLLPFLGLALIRALRSFPQCNTTYDKGRNVLLRHEAVHLGVATQTPDGLKVPVVRNAECMSVDTLAGEIRRVSEAARNNTAKKDELGGSTITITSLGKLGGIASTPVINLPEVGIIGVNKAVERPMIVNGQVAVRLMMNLSSSFDHRFVDGYDAAAMIQQIKDMLEHPATIFIT
jgi:2-oxoisovalerate dehydrogenase E2 component (dihydrolipoyl transacylase)